MSHDRSEQIAQLSPKRLALLCLELQAQVDALRGAASESIAVIGLSCRFPGADGPEAFWELLRGGRDAVGEVPATRWDVEAFYDPDPEAPGKMYTRHGAFLDRVDGFDPQFFGISPREAAGMDPQHRLLLEVSWEALERAGWPPERLSGSRTGVFVGIGIDDYAKRQVRSLPFDSIDAYTGTGNAFCFAAGRLSYLLGLQGPSLALDTACSTSLVAVHLACQSLRSRECSLALAGGVNLMLSPEPTLFLSKARALAPDGRCKTFDAAADGYGRGEGCGVVVLKRLSDARRDGDEILAVIRGSAVNHDGPSSGLTVPNGLAQQAVIRDALAGAGLTPADVSYIEAHGTGTLVGDPIEVRALSAVFGPGRAPRQPLTVASVKTNIGHLEVAAGVASLIKVVLALRHRQIPPHLHLKQVNPFVDLEAIPARVPTVLQPWPDQGAARVAGISAFGLSGTNAHVVVQEAREEPPPAPQAADDGAHLVPLSARSPQALFALARAWRRSLAEHAGLALRDVAYTAAVRRSHHAQRLVLRVRSLAELRAGLERFVQGDAPAGAWTGGGAVDAPRVALVFSGQAEALPHLRALLDAPAARRLPVGAGGRGRGGAGLGADPEPAPARELVALQVALAELLRAGGARVAAVTGHGAGELAAACAAGALDLVDALRLAGDPAAGGDALVVRPRETSVPFVSGLTGRVVAGPELGPRHWTRALGAACLAAALPDSLRELNCGLVLEVGPAAPWSTPPSGARTERGRLCLCVPGEADGPGDALARLLGWLYAEGSALDWQALSPQGRLVPLPTYPWQRERFWIDTSHVAGHGSGAGAARRTGPQHPLLGPPLHLAASGAVVFQPALDLATFLADHRILAERIMPATACLEMALGAAVSVFGTVNCVVEEVEIREPLRLDPEAAANVQLSVQARDSQAAAFELWSSGPTASTLHASGRLRREAPQATRPPQGLAAIRGRCTQELEGAAYYRTLRRLGLDFGPTFRGLQKIQRRDGEALGRVHLVDALESEAPSYRIHPALLDACFHVFGAALPDERPAGAYVPVRIGSFRLHKPPLTPLWALATLQTETAAEGVGFRGELRVLDESGELVAEVEGLEFRRVDGGAWRGLRGSGEESWLHAVRWRAEELSESGSEVGAWRAGERWLVLGDAGGVGEALARRLRGAGAQCEVWSASAYKEVSGEAAEEALRGRLSEYAGRDGEGWRWRGVVHLWGLEGRAGGGVVSWVTWGSALSVMQAVSGSGRTGDVELCVVTRGSQSLFGESPEVEQSALWGLGGVWSAEHEESRCRRVDLDPQWGTAEDEAEFVFRELERGGREEQVSSRGGRYVARLGRVNAGVMESQRRGVSVEVARRGVLDLELGRLERRAPGAGEVELRVLATGLNFKDVMSVLGLYPGDAGRLGGECCGRVVRVGEGVEGIVEGDEVVSASEGSFASHVTVSVGRVARKPAVLSAADAASIPVAFLTASYALEHLGRVRAGERVLIHAASGGVGLAAVQLAQRAGARVYATAGSERKRAYLKSVGVEHVMSSRSLDFAQEVMSASCGRGVDVVLNALSGEFIEKSLELVCRGGRFLEIGKTGILSAQRAKELRGDVEYHAIALDQVWLEPGRVGRELEGVLERFASGELRVLPRREYELEDVSGAFRYMAQARHIGKVVVRQREEGRFEGELSGTGAYVVTGGLGALGLRAARWLVDNGARHVVLLGRAGAGEQAQGVVRELEQSGAQVWVRRCDVSRSEDVGRVLEELSGAGRRVRGVVHAAGVLDDGVVEQQSWSRAQEVLKGKAQGAWQLHEQLGSHGLDFFVMYSSLASVLGAAGQSSYAAANAYLDGLAHVRRARGQHALSVNWGPWSQEGMASGVGESRWARRGLRRLGPEEGLRALEQALSSDWTQVSVGPVNWAQLLGGYTAGRTPTLLSELVSDEAARPASSDAGGAEPELVKTLRGARAQDRRALLLEHLREQVRVLLELRPGQALPEDQGLVDLGLDSLMVVDLRNRLLHDLKQELPATLAFDYPTLNALTDHLLERLALPGSADGVRRAGPADPDLARVLDQLESLSEDEALALLGEKTDEAQA